jgi:hypothetical protein
MNPNYVQSRSNCPSCVVLKRQNSALKTENEQLRNKKEQLEIKMTNLLEKIRDIRELFNETNHHYGNQLARRDRHLLAQTNQCQDLIARHKAVSFENKKLKKRTKKDRQLISQIHDQVKELNEKLEEKNKQIEEVSKDVDKQLDELATRKLIEERAKSESSSIQSRNKKEVLNNAICIGSLASVFISLSYCTNPNKMDFREIVGSIVSSTLIVNATKRYLRKKKYEKILNLILEVYQKKHKTVRKIDALSEALRNPFFLKCLHSGLSEKTELEIHNYFQSNLFLQATD